MKITDALESVLRLLVTTDDDRAEHAVDRPVPEWVKRVNGGSDSAAPREAASPAPAAADAEPEDETVEPEGRVEENQAAPALLDSLLTWVQSHEDAPAPIAGAESELAPEPELALEPELAPEPAPAPEPASPPEPIEVVAAVSPAVVQVAPDLAHLETAAEVAESLNLGFHLGSAVERIASAAAQGSDGVQSLREATWLIERYISIIENRPLGADLHLTATRLARAGDAIAGLKALAETLGDETEA
jgi:hypothetical protein